ncbi:MAG: DUF6985 domain-containing protein, partial [Paracoccaceae bacterium]
RVLAGCDKASDGTPVAFVMLTGACDWDDEHGILMCWQDGKTLCRVSGSDGHFTNSFVEGQAPRIYDCSTPGMSTLADGTRV